MFWVKSSKINWLNRIQNNEHSTKYLNENMEIESKIDKIFARDPAKIESN